MAIKGAGHAGVQQFEIKRKKLKGLKPRFGGREGRGAPSPRRLRALRGGTGGPGRARRREGGEASGRPPAVPTFADGLVGPQLVAALAVSVSLAVVAQHPRRRLEVLLHGVQVVGEPLAACKAPPVSGQPPGPAAPGSPWSRLPSGSFSLKHW